MCKWLPNLEIYINHRVVNVMRLCNMILFLHTECCFCFFRRGPCFCSTCCRFYHFLVFRVQLPYNDWEQKLQTILLCDNWNWLRSIHNELQLFLSHLLPWRSCQYNRGNCYREQQSCRDDCLDTWITENDTDIAGIILMSLIWTGKGWLSFSGR